MLKFECKMLTFELRVPCCREDFLAYRLYRVLKSVNTLVDKFGAKWSQYFKILPEVIFKG